MRRSRRWLVSILFAQNAAFVVGLAREHTGQPCQKQPSTNTAMRSARQTKSGRPGIGRCLRHPLSPAARNKSRRRSSVLRLPVPRTACIVRERSAGTPGQRLLVIAYQRSVRSAASGWRRVCGHRRTVHSHARAERQRRPAPCQATGFPCQVQPGSCRFARNRIDWRTLLASDGLTGMFIEEMGESLISKSQRTRFITKPRTLPLTDMKTTAARPVPSSH